MVPSETTGATSFRTEAQETIDKITNKMTIEFFAISACGESGHIQSSCKKLIIVPKEWQWSEQQCTNAFPAKNGLIS